MALTRYFHQLFPDSLVVMAEDEKVEMKNRFDRDAFEAIVEEYIKPVFNIAYRMVNDYEDAMDITQTTFMKAYEKRESYNPRYKVFSWLYRIAVNESLNHLQKRKRESNLTHELADRRLTPEQFMIQNETTSSVQSAIMDLGLDYRIVIVLKHFQHLSYREISQILDIPEKRIKSRLFSARQLLKEKLTAKGFKQ
jgi:RNA polymerase sigma-70 factor (ECF subfamily)